MALPTCACVASLPPMQRWAAIAAMAQTWAGSTVTPIACARTFNEILNDLYCALYTVAEDGPAPDLPELLASFDISDPANIASFTRAGAAGFTTTGDSDELQREAAEDVLRIHKGGVLLENSPTACALVAPGVPSVTPGELEFSATFSGIPITASLQRYDYQIDSDGWVSNGTSTTLTDIVATAGDHTLSVRAVSTSGVAGAVATSATFTVTAPASSYLLSDDFIYADAAAAAVGGWTDAGSPVWGSGKLSLDGSTDSSVKDFTVAAGDVWAFFPMTVASAVSAQGVYILDASSNVLAEVRVRTGGLLRVTHGATLATSGGALYTAATVAYIWVHYVKGTGANGVLDVYVSSDTTRGAADLQITTGTATADAAKIRFGTTGSATVFDFDRVRVDDAEIGDNPS